MARPKIYKINEEYFSSRLTKNGAYILGLIFSDGHLDYDRGKLEYACSSKDISLINFIKKELGSTHPIKNIIINNRSYSRYCISSKKMIQSIINKYQLPRSNKSQNNLFMPDIEERLTSHFLRGFFDGDGSIWFGGGTYRGSYTGGENMMKNIQFILEKMAIPSYISYRYSSDNKNSCNLSINGTLNVSSFGKYLYKDADYFLERKYKKFQDCFRQERYIAARSLLLSGNQERIKRLYTGGMKQEDISRKLSIISSSVRGCIQRLRRNKEVV